MKQLLRITILLLSTTIVACLPEVETIDPSTIVEWENYTTSNGLAGNRVNAIAADSEGNLWFATDNGVSKFDGTSYTNYRTPDLINNFVTSIVEFEPGVMAFGTDGGLSVLDNGSWFSVNFRTPPPESEIIPYGVISLGIDKNGVGWIGTDVLGLIYYNGSYWQSWDFDCSDCNYVNFIYLDSKNVMWYGTAGGLKKRRGNSFTEFDLFTTSNGLPDNWVQSVFEDSWGTLWAGTYDGLSKMKGAGFETVSLYNSATLNWTYTINQDAKNNNWFSSFGNGLIYSNGSSMRTDPETLADKRISTISSFRDNNGALWFGTFEGGLWKYIPK